MTGDLRTHIQSSLGGAYTIERELGGGGMSHVFVAEDTALGRRVVVKVLKPELAAGTSSERFRREIGLAARLQHPLVVPLLAAGELDGGLLYYTMPFIEGEALRQRLTREGALPVADAVAILRDTLEALAYAHGRDVVHRDIKPDNILLSGRHALITDFGVARAIMAASGNSLTSTGLVLGTPAYMAPEQAANDILDHRADLYAAGAVGYEMLAGCAPFTAPSLQALLAAQMTRAPDPITTYRPNIPAPVAALIMKLLEKHPADRPQTADAALRDLDKWEPSTDASTAPVMAPTTSKAGTAIAATSTRTFLQRLAPHARSIPWILISLFVASVVVLAWSTVTRPDERPLSRFEMTGPEMDELGDVRIARDGRLIVYSGLGARGPQLFVRYMEELGPHPIRGTEGATLPFLSPDARSVAFFSDGALKKVPITGGSAVTLASAIGWQGGTWGSTGIIVFGDSGMLKRVSADGGPVQLVTRPDSALGERVLRSPHFLPDGDAVVYGTGWGNSRFAVVTLRGEKTILSQDSLSNPSYLSSGYLLGQRDGHVYAFPFSPRRRRITGPGSIVLGIPPSQLAVSDNGSLVFVERSTDAVVVSVDLDRKGRLDTLLSESSNYRDPRLSPDGQQLAVAIEEGMRRDIWVYSLKAGTLQRLTFGGQNEYPEWSPDGKRILFTEELLAEDIFSVAADGSKSPELLVALPGLEAGASWTPDGRHIIYRHGESGGQGRDVMMLSLDSLRMPRVLLASPSDEFAPRVSPDGRWLAYSSDESGRHEVYVRSFPAMTGKTQISSGGGGEPLWTRDARQLLYRSGRQIVAVRLGSGRPLSVENRQVLLEGTYKARALHPNYDVSANGRRFILLQPSEKGRRIVAILNWKPDLREDARDRH